VGGGSLNGRPDPKFWEDYWAGASAAMAEYAVKADRIFPKLWMPGGWAGLYGSYQAQLKELMRMLGQPAGHVRHPRLPVSDPAKLEILRNVLIEEGLLTAEGVPT
jgi:4-hydroxy-tetrahydrodipicolinate synthase